MGHPYASRHGSQGIPIHDPYWLIHSQTGRLLGAKRTGVAEASVTGAELKASAYVGLDETEAVYALCLIWGTSKMIPRDVLSGSLEKVKEQARVYLQENLRDMIFNFKGLETQ